MLGAGEGAHPKDRVWRLQRLTAALAEASTAVEVAAVTAGAGLVEAGSVCGSVWLPERAELVPAGAVWASEAQRERFARVPIAANLPATEAFRTGTAVWVGDRKTSAARFPDLGPTTSEAYFALPLAGTKTVLGVFAGTLDGAPSEDDKTFVETVAALCAQALERTQAYERERRARETLEFLAEATEAMVSANEPDEVLQSLVRLAVPRLAAWCAVYVAERGGLRQAAVAADFGGTADITPRLYLPLNASTIVTRVFRAGVVPEIVHIDERLLQAYYPAQAAARLLGLGLTAGLAAPIRLRGENVGLLVLALQRDSEEFRFAATGLAARAAIALENAQRHRHQHDVVRTLTEALLPTELPAVDGYDLAARYVPSSGGVCGDWYEVEASPAGRLWLGLGDASGHGIAAASTMALVRNAALGVREIEQEPAQLMAILSRVVEHARPSDIVTAIYGTLEPGSGHLRWCSAGHPHGVVLSVDGSMDELPGVHGPPLGVRSEYETNRYRLEPGDTLVLYTDGIVERRGEDVGVGVKRLVDLIAGSYPVTAPELADLIVEELCADRDDDCCLLIVRRSPPG
jgi:serine phosphatase RsbU (regulator of sigma subunit)